MRWSERQRRMLQEMGIPVWAPDTPAPEPAGAMPVEQPRPVAPSTTAIVQTHGSPPLIAAPMPSAPALAPAASRAADGAGVVALGGDAAARAHMISTLSWPALREAVAACTACRLCETRRQTVFGAGHESARWLIVGEAPGEQEDQIGEPFVGAAGQLLDNMLQALRLTRGDASAGQQVYIANTLKCRPPRNRNPEAEELRQCEPFLMRQIALLRPGIILAMGRFAVQSLLRSSEPIGKLRGRVHRYQGVPLVVTYHPAYLLRNLADKARAWEDLCLAAQTAETADDPGRETARPAQA